MDRSLIKTLMPSLVAGHVPRNVRSIKYRVFDDQPQPSALGFAFDPQPFDGKVVAAMQLLTKAGAAKVGLSMALPDGA